MFKKMGGNPINITHVVSHSTTGWNVPGLSHHIIYNLKLSKSARAIPVNFVGCQGIYYLYICIFFFL